MGLDTKCISRVARKSSKNTRANALYVVVDESVVVTVLVSVLTMNVGVGVEVVVSVVTLVCTIGV